MTAPMFSRPIDRLPLLRAVCEHGVGLVFVRPDTRRAGPPSAGPFVAIVEDRPLSWGPVAFDPLSLRVLLRAVHGVVVVCGAFGPRPYRQAATLVGLGVSSLVVETAAEHGRAWRTFVHAAAPTLPVVLIRE